MCEGPNELAIVTMLLDAGRFIFTRDDLLGLVPYHARQLSSTAVRTNLNQYAGTVKVLRIGDTLTDKLKISKDDQEKIKSVEKYCTKPELEMLLIIAEGLTAEFEKVKMDGGEYVEGVNALDLYGSLACSSLVYCPPIFLFWSL